MHCECCITSRHLTVYNISIWLHGQCSTPLKILKHKRGKPLKSGEKRIVLNVFNKFKRIYKFMFKQTRFPHTSKRKWHRSVLTVQRKMHVSHTFCANGGRIHNAVPVQLSQSEISESTCICWHQDRSSTEFGIDATGYTASFYYEKDVTFSSLFSGFRTKFEVEAQLQLITVPEGKRGNTPLFCSWVFYDWVYVEVYPQVLLQGWKCLLVLLRWGW